MDERRRQLLRQLPKVDELIDHFRQQALWPQTPRRVLTQVIRQELEETRQRLLALPSSALPAAIDQAALRRQIAAQLEESRRPRLIPLINASGVIIHTNLGRSPLAEAAIDQIVKVARHYSNLEYDLAAGQRGSRHSHLEHILREITGAEAALVVNNNAGAVFLTLNTMAYGKEVIVSRGQLVEIGGSFRMPDVMRASGAILREVGATNKTHLYDYENAIGPETAMLMKVHTSNFRITGFTKEISLAELVALGQKHGLPVVEDLGSGCFIDFSRYGLEKEPTVTEALATGADLVLFSGDKLLGGPQAGLAVGRKVYVDRLKRNPLTRALRPDKLTLAGLEATLRLYRDEQQALAAIPTLRMLTQTAVEVKRRAQSLARRLRRRLPPEATVTLVPTISRVGGGSLPQIELPSWALNLDHPDWPAHKLDRALHDTTPPIIGRVEHQKLLLDVRTILPEDEGTFLEVLSGRLGQAGVEDRDQSG
jgi:L-seryl-tRNA(Ser) seleniumtransferase